LHPDSKGRKSFLSRSIDNPHLDKEEIKATKDDLSDYTFRQEYEDGFLIFAGRIYKHFNSEINYKDMFYNKDLPLYMTHDFGFITPLVCSFVQNNKIDGEIYFYLIDVIKEVLDDDLELYDFYITNYNYFKANIFKTWIKVGNDLEEDDRRKL